MLVTNQTSSDIYFGPLHLGAGVGTTLTVDDTTATSLYLTNDSVADALNNAYNSGQIDVSGAADPFPRPTGTPALLHGDGNPEGLVFSPQGSLYMRRDGVVSNGGGLYVKTTGATVSTGWVDMPTASGASSDSMTVEPHGCLVPERRERLIATIGFLPIIGFGGFVSASDTLLIGVFGTALIYAAYADLRLLKRKRFDPNRLPRLQRAQLEPVMRTVRRMLLVPGVLVPMAIGGIWLPVAASVAGGLSAGYAAGFLVRVWLYTRLERRLDASLVTSAPDRIFRKRGLQWYLLSRKPEITQR